jgi:hypothetical protein
MLCAYREKTVTETQHLWIERHLGACDFCAAEFRLLSEHPPLEETCPLSEIPPHLRRLAESLMYPVSFALDRWAEAFASEPSLSDAYN